MASVIVCDICDTRLGEAERKPFKYGDRTIRLGAQSLKSKDFVPMDMCLNCMLLIISAAVGEAIVLKEG